MQNRYTGDVGDFAKYGLMRQFNDAGFRMALYEQKKIDWNGTKRFFKGMAADPTTYVGLSTLGLGAIMGAAAKQATKAGIVAALKAGLPTTAVAAIEGGDLSTWRRAPTRNGEGFLTAPVTFSADGVDPGSRLLVEALPPLTGRVADLGWKRSLEILRPGMSELEWRAEIERVMTAEGADGYFNMLGAGRPAGEEDLLRGFGGSPTARTFQKGDLALLEITPRVEGYWNQVVRLVSLGEPPEDIQKAHDACLAAKRSALERLKPGETFTAVAESIGGTLEKHGYSMKGVGSVHTTGLDLSESTMNLDNERKIEPRLLVTVHPMMATGDWRQLFVGESYFLHEDRLERLNHCGEESAVLSG